MLAWRSAFEFLNLVRCPRWHTTTLVAIRQSGLACHAIVWRRRKLFVLSDLSALTSVLWSCGFESFEPFGHFGFDRIEAYERLH